MTNQEVFDKVAKHLLTQNKKSKVEDCLYRGPNGLKCAIGVLIPDDKYSPAFENRAISDSWCDRELRLAAGLRDYQCKLASSLQRLHDMFLPEFWSVRLTKIAEEFKLSAKVVYEHNSRPD